MLSSIGMFGQNKVATVATISSTAIIEVVLSLRTESLDSGVDFMSWFMLLKQTVKEGASENDTILITEKK